MAASTGAAAASKEAAAPSMNDGGVLRPGQHRRLGAAGLAMPASISSSASSSAASASAACSAACRWSAAARSGSALRRLGRSRPEQEGDDHHDTERRHESSHAAPIMPRWAPTTPNWSKRCAGSPRPSCTSTLTAPCAGDRRRAGRRRRRRPHPRRRPTPPRRPPRCRDQAELLTYFELPISLLQSTDALRRAAAELVEDMAADGVTYGEIRWGHASTSSRAWA